jgi:hypothetical protein
MDRVALKQATDQPSLLADGRTNVEITAVSTDRAATARTHPGDTVLPCV